MSALANLVSLHPYFKVHRGKLEAVKGGFPRFVEKTATEKRNLFLRLHHASATAAKELTLWHKVNPLKLSPRGYESAEGVLAHLKNVGALLAEMLTMADLTRVEVHGPAAELEKLKAPLAHLNPAWFAIETSK